MLEGVDVGKRELELLRRYVLFVGGGTCSGKSTLADSFACARGVDLFSADDHLGNYANLAAARGSELVRGTLGVNLEWFWMRDPREQFTEMLGFYQDVFPHVVADLSSRVSSVAQRRHASLDDRRIAPLVVAEGIAFLPDLLVALNIPAEHCLFLVAGNPEHDERYAKRNWVPLMLEDCDDPQEAFARWMRRDEFFTDYIRERCEALELECLDTSDPSVLPALSKLASGGQWPGVSRSAEA